MEKKTRSLLQMITIFCVYILVNLTFAHALTISHSPDTDANASRTSAEIEWKTDEPADSSVEYGEDPGLALSESSSDPVENHSITLTGLDEGMTYYYKLISSTDDETATADNGGDLFSFNTAAADDTTPPELNVSLPEYYNRERITFGGYTDPDSVLKVYVNKPSSDVGTDSYTQLTTSDSSGHFTFKYINLKEENEIVIWVKDPSGNTNTASYSLLVDNERPDVKLDRIPSLSASASLTINGTVNENVTLIYSVNDRKDEKPLGSGRFSIDLNLDQEKTNNIDLQFSDKAGNVYEKEFSVEVDAQGPRIRWHNLDALDPSYIQEVEVEGNVSKPGALVAVYVNNKTHSSESWSTSMMDTLTHLGSLVKEGDYEYVTKADDEGHFSMDVFLTQEIKSQKEEYLYDPRGTSPSGDTGGPGGGATTVGTSAQAAGTSSTGPTGQFSNAWDNHIKIVAIDELGRTDETDESIVTFARCGYGADWNIEVSDVTPSVIIPEHLRKGLAQLAFNVELEWQGPGEKPEIIREPILQQYKLSRAVKEQYAFDPNQILGGVQDVWSRDKKKGYAVLELQQKDYEQEELSDMDKDDLIIKLPMELELEYSYDDGSGRRVTQVQKQCWDVSVALDVQVPPSVIPKQLLNSSIAAINTTINAIDRILKPLKAATLTTFVTCLLSWVMYFFALMQKAQACMGQEGDDKSQNCLEAEENAKKVEKYMHYICDRVFCPSVPLADVYFQESASQECIGEALNPEMTKDDDGCGQEYMDKWDSGCLMMNELSRSKCIKYERTKDPRYQQYCGEAASLKNIWYGVSDFCSKKEEQGARRVSVSEGEGRTDEYLIDKEGKVNRVSRMTVSQVEETGEGSYKVSEGAAESTYTTKPLVDYEKAGEDGRVEYDEEGKIYYKNEEGSKTYLCEERQSGDIMEIRGGESNTKDEACAGGSAMTLPKDVMKAADLPQSRKYVVDPTDNLFTALQCVCLPGITGFLVMFKNVLGAVRQCFQSILIKGEGSTGLCRSVLTTYICDLVFDAIRCFVNRYSAGHGQDPGDAGRGISSFFKSAATAGKDVQESITGRYGESSMYKTMFSERKLIHAACLYAFTGDFDFDIESALTGPGAVSIESQAFLYPRTRRFISSNPLTGYTTQIYHIGAGLVAGDDIGYKLQLVCSNDASCDPQQGFPNGNCDCYKAGQEKVRDITYSFGPGRLMAGEMLGPNEGDIYLKVSDAKYRYDKVRLKYWEEGKSPKTIEKKMRQIGGNPPADCRVTSNGEFRCSYDVGDSGYAIFAENPEPTKELYYLNDVMNVDFKIDKKSPGGEEGESQQPRPFYLRYSIESLKGNLVSDKAIAIVPDGIQEPPANIPGIKITKDLLTGRGAGDNYKIKGELPPGVSKRVRPYDVDLPNIYEDSESKNNPPTSFAIYVRETGEEKFEVRACEGSFKEEEKGGGTKEVFYNADGSREMCSGPKVTSSDPRNSNLKLDEKPGQNKITVTYNGIDMDIKYSSISEDWGGFLIQYEPSDTEDIGCSTEFTTATPAEFKLTMGLYPCQRRDKDRPYSVSNCEPSPMPVDYYGNVQEHEIRMRAVCSEGGGAYQGQRCQVGVRTPYPCECRAPSEELGGKNNCGEDGSDENYCFFMGPDEYECLEYKACPKSTEDDPVNIDDSNEAVMVERTGNNYAYCDCNGDQRMEDCTNKYCYRDAGRGEGCWPNPP
ncbi:MAG: fibronectin type III domain-containing protein [Candidatus Woesearchaeota archaeon]